MRVQVSYVVLGKVKDARVYVHPRRPLQAERSMKGRGK